MLSHTASSYEKEATEKLSELCSEDTHSLIFVYIDAFNLYYGARSKCNRDKSGWRWLDIRKLIHHQISKHTKWKNYSLVIKYFTADVMGKRNQENNEKQALYVQALTHSDSVDEVIKGKYVERITQGALMKRTNSKPELVMYQEEMNNIEWFNFKAKEWSENEDILIIESHRFEEKQTDVNIATHLLTDTFNERSDAAIVVTNDGDLYLPIKECRRHLPLAVLNPTKALAPGGFMVDKNSKGHWNSEITAEDYFQSQLPPKIRHRTKQHKLIKKPSLW